MTVDRETEIRAPISGTVSRILISIGETVREGAELMLLESMKMEIPVEASCSGSVVRIVVSVGDRINEGDPLVVIG